MADASNLFDLAASVTVETRGVDKNLGNTQKNVEALSKELDNLDKDVKTVGSGLTRNLGGPLGRIDSQLSAITKGALPAVAAGLTVVTAAATAAGAAVVKSLADFAAFGSKISDLSAQTGLGAESLTSLKFAAEQGGASLEKITQGLQRFSVTVANAARGSEAAKEKMRALGIDPQEAIGDLEGALGKVFKRINEAPPGIAKVTLATDAFGDSGARLLPVIEAMDGDFEALKKRARELGLVFSDEMARDAAKLDDTLGLIRTQVAALGYQFAKEFAPEVTRSLQAISKAMADNKAQAADWGKALADTFRGAQTFASSYIGKLVRDIAGLTVALNPAILGLKALQQYGASVRPSEAGEDPFGPGGAMRGGRKTLPGTPEHKAEAERLARMKQALDDSIFAAPAPARGGGRAARSEKDVGLELLKQLQKEFAGLTAKTEVQKTALKLLGGEYKNLDNTVRDQILNIARQIDVKTKLQKIEGEIRSFMEGQTEAIQRLTIGSQDYLAEAQLQLKNWEKQGAIIPEVVSWWAQFDATILQSTDSIKRLNTELADLQGLILTLPEIDVNKAIGARLEGMLGPPPSGAALVHAAELQKLRDSLQGMAGDLTYMMDRAIFDGLTQGAGRGFASLGIGLLDLLRYSFLEQLKKGILDVLATSFSQYSVGKGSFLTKAIGAFVSVLGGSIGGGAKPGGGAGGWNFGAFAEGGFMRPHSIGLVGERGPELIKAGPHGATVTPDAGRPVINQTIVINVPNAAAAGSRDTQAQVARRYRQLMQKEALR